VANKGRPTPKRDVSCCKILTLGIGFPPPGPDGIFAVIEKKKKKETKGGGGRKKRRIDHQDARKPTCRQGKGKKIKEDQGKRDEMKGRQVIRSVGLFALGTIEKGSMSARSSYKTFQNGKSPWLFRTKKQKTENRETKRHRKISRMGELRKGRRHKEIHQQKI